MFVSFEGPEGAGKSTAISVVRERLEEKGHRVLVTREPGAGEFGKAVRKLLLHTEEVEPAAELFLFLADRAQHVAKTIAPALENGEVVLCDRHADSTVVYQGYGRGFYLEQLREWNLLATQGLKPNLTLLFDLPVEIGLARLTNKDRLDREPPEFHEKIRAGFLSEAEREPERWVVLNATKASEELASDALKAIEERLTRL